MSASVNTGEFDELVSDEETTTNSIEKLPSSLDKSFNQTNVLKVKTSNVPGPVGLLPILKTAEDLKHLKNDKTARDTLTTEEENSNVKRAKRSADLFSLNIDNYPSHETALRQLQNMFGCEPISIKTATIKARLGIKKRIPLMCVAVTHYDRQENTILLDQTGHIRATFIGDDEMFDNYNIRVGHTLILRNVAVFTANRHRHHYVNIHLQNIIAIQDPLNEMFDVPTLISEEFSRGKSILDCIEAEINAYADTSRVINETFQLFSQSDLNDDEDKRSTKQNPTFHRIQSAPTTNLPKKFSTTSNETSRPSVPPAQPTNEGQKANDNILDEIAEEVFDDW